MKIGSIYCLICPISKEYRYVGKTTQLLKNRLCAHKSKINNSISYKNSWLKKLDKLNLLNELQIVLIESVEIYNNDISYLNNREIYWIKYFKDNGYKLTNLTIGGEGTLGYKHKPEALLKISEASKRGKGRKLSSEAKKNISKSLIGNTRHLCKMHSNETKEKISKSKKGSIPVNRKEIHQYNLNMDFIKTWLSAYHAANELNLNQGNISQVANGIRKKCGEYIWKY